MTKVEKIKYLLAPAIGFGVGGALWGLFHIFEGVELFGAILIGLIGTASLVLFREEIRIQRKIFIILGGVIVWVIIFYLIDILGGIGMIFPLLFIVCVLSFGIIISLFYALILRSRVSSLLWRGEIGFIATLIIGSAFKDLAGGILGFGLAGIILGLFLGWGIYRGQKTKT